jgi:hypothetical protein
MAKVIMKGHIIYELPTIKKTVHEICLLMFYDI